MKELLNKLESAQIDYLGAVARQSGVPSAREKLKNILFNNCKAIVETLRAFADGKKEADDLREDLAVMEAALADADEENKRLAAELEQMRKPKTRKTKTEE